MSYESHREPLGTCALCGQPIYNVDDTTYYFVTNEDTGDFTTDPTEILNHGEDLDGKHIHIMCDPSQWRSRAG